MTLKFKNNNKKDNIGICASQHLSFSIGKKNKQTSWSSRIFAWKICSGYFPIDYNYMISGLLPYAQINACFRSSFQCSSFNLILSSFKMKGNELNVFQKETLNLCVVLAVLSQFYSKHFKVYISPPRLHNQSSIMFSES